MQWEGSKDDRVKVLWSVIYILSAQKSWWSEDPGQWKVDRTTENFSNISYIMKEISHILGVNQDHWFENIFGKTVNMNHNLPILAAIALMIHCTNTNDSVYLNFSAFSPSPYFPFVLQNFIRTDSFLSESSWT